MARRADDDARPAAWLRRRAAAARDQSRPAGRTGAALAALAAGSALAWWCAGAAGRTGGAGTVASWDVALVLMLTAAAGALLAVIDARTHRLPDAIVLPAWAAAVALLALGAAVQADATTLWRGALGGAIAYSVHAALRLAYPPGLGYGDVKLAGLLGTALGAVGWAELAVGMLAPFLLGGLWALVLLVTRRASRRTAVPFGPFMVLGAVLGAAWAPAVVAAYGFA